MARVFAGSLVGELVRRMVPLAIVAALIGRSDLDEAAVRAEAQVQAEEVARRVVADPVHKEMALLEAMEKGYL